jgi:hypothetical protein
MLSGSLNGDQVRQDTPIAVRSGRSFSNVLGLAGSLLRSREAMFLAEWRVGIGFRRERLKE